MVGLDLVDCIIALPGHTYCGQGRYASRLEKGVALQFCLPSSIWRSAIFAFDNLDTAYSLVRN